MMPSKFKKLRLISKPKIKDKLVHRIHGTGNEKGFEI
jgi:hypothetical protein